MKKTLHKVRLYFARLGKVNLGYIIIQNRYHVLMKLSANVAKVKINKQEKMYF